MGKRKKLNNVRVGQIVSLADRPHIKILKKGDFINE